MDKTAITNTFSAFKMPEQYKQQTQKVQSAPCSNVQNDSFESSNKPKVNKKTLALLGGALVAAGATALYFLKFRKKPTESILEIKDILSLPQRATQTLAELKKAEKLAAASKKINKHAQSGAAIALPEFTQSTLDIKKAQEASQAAAEAARKLELTSIIKNRINAKNALRRSSKISQDAFRAGIEKNLSHKSAKESAEAIFALQNIEVADKLKKAATPSNVLMLPEKAGTTISEAQKDALLGDSVKNAVNFALASFGIGGIIEAARAIKKEQVASDEELKLKELILKQEKNIKEYDAPFCALEAQDLKDNFENSILPNLPKIEKSAQVLRTIAQKFEQTGFEGEITKTQKDSNGVTYTSLFTKTGDKVCTVASMGSDVQGVELYDNEGSLFAKSSFRKNATGGENYMSHYIKYDKATGKVAGTIVYDEDNNVKSYLSRAVNGNLNKLFILDSSTGSLKRACLTDDGKKCTKKYEFDKNGNLEKVCLDKTEKMPKMDYLYENNEPKGVDVYAKGSNSVPLFNVDFN